MEGPIGRLGDDYVLIREIASGGMGRVYLAREIGPAGYSRTIALKRIHDHLADRRAFVTMFLDEARIASRINHPHVCTVLDFGEVDGAYYIAMEYMRGQPISELLRELGRSAPTESPERYSLGAYLLAQACEGLHAAHELRDESGKPLNVVHRDVSPHNLFVTYDGSTRVLDFGVARAADRLSDSTTGRVKGKFAYMAPEQALGHRVDRRADVFSLGIVLWELLTLRRLYRRDNPGETVLALVQQSPPTPRSVVAEVPEALEAIAMKALSKEPGDRFETARDMGRAITQAMANETWAVSPGDITDWLDQVFPGKREASHRLLLSAEAIQKLPEPTPTHTRRRGLSMSTTTEPTSGWRRALPFALIGGLLGVVIVGGAVLASSLPEAVPRATLPAAGGERAQTTPAAREPSEPPEEDPNAGAQAQDTEAPEQTDLVIATPEVPAPASAGDSAPIGSRRRGRTPSGRSSARAGRGTRGGGRSGARAGSRGGSTAAPAGRGQVLVSGPQTLWGARILFGGRQVGTVPGTVRLPAGRQTVDIVAAGRPRMRRAVTVTPNGNSRIVLH